MSPEAWYDTHPFITFAFDTRTIPAPSWLMIGESMSKGQHLAGVPLKPDFAARLASIYLARGAQSTTAIEGNTLTTQQVLDIVNKGTADLPESREYLERENANIIDLLRDIDDCLQEGIVLPINIERICEINRRVLAGIPDKPHVIPGALRTYEVTAGPYLAPHHDHVDELMRHLVKWLAEVRDTQQKATTREDRFTTALLGAILTHLYVAWIHPFGNGNGRTARLIEVQMLSESGVVPIVSTNLLSDHYNKTRDAYYRALEEAQRDVSAFVRYAVEGFRDELRSQVDEVRAENISVHWQSYVYEEFDKLPHTDARARQREVALFMPAEVLLTPEQMTDLTPSIARKYAICGERVPARDLNDLAKMGLVTRVSRRQYTVRRDIIRAFLPPVSH